MRASLLPIVEFSRNYANRLKPIIPHLEAEKRKLENSFYDFVTAAWPHCGSTMAFMDNWHIRVVCEHLEEFAKGSIGYFVCNLPVRVGKSSLVCVLFPAWVWAKNARAQFIFGSYSKKFAMRDSVFCNQLISSSWYQERWGDKVQLTRRINNVEKFELTAGGIRQVVSVGSLITGMNADYIVCDDPNQAVSVHSSSVRYRTNLWWDQAVSLRFNDLRQSRRMVVQQRLHEDDLTGHILGSENSNVTHLYIPMEYDPANHCKTIPLKSSNGVAWEDPRNESGELLWPGYIDAKLLGEIKQSLGSEYACAGQLQQRPAPAGGGIIKSEWFNWWCETETPPVHYVLQSWDTAYSGLDPKKVSADKTTCFSACTTWGIFDDDQGVAQCILLDSWKGKVEYPELRKAAADFASRRYSPVGKSCDVILIEAKANGLSLLQDLRRVGVMATKFDPTPFGNKEMRARKITHIIESGRVWLPAIAPNYQHLKSYAKEFLDSCSMFPNGLSNDIVDSMSQALIKIYQSGLLTHPDDEQKRMVYLKVNKDKSFY